MPSPIAHSVSGYVLTRLPIVKNIIPSRLWPITPAAALYSLFVANSPDLDFLGQLLTGLQLHRGPSHSLLAALIVSGLLAWLVHRYRPQSSYGNLFSFTFGLYGSHLLLDLFTAGGRGIPLLWPLSSQYFQSPFALFPGVHYSRGLWDNSHLIFIGAELLYSLVLLSGLQIWKARADHQVSR
ncbi:MAG: metal-dependent hydrolase [Phormidesmis sp.]